ncbi:hypothetical protein PSN45_003297 [Yamadazyma tenuis]|uniref:uncharacterized protein n=1 Tax=Candida tenuis TaxID=2315449 RepID=UPI0027A31D8B|nr:hypothetical protein PSN45_003297 [Yamadazyma tenuis]
MMLVPTNHRSVETDFHFSINVSHPQFNLPPKSKFQQFMANIKETFIHPKYRGPKHKVKRIKKKSLIPQHKINHHRSKYENKKRGFRGKIANGKDKVHAKKEKLFKRFKYAKTHVKCFFASGTKRMSRIHKTQSLRTRVMLQQRKLSWKCRADSKKMKALIIVKKLKALIKSFISSSAYDWHSKVRNFQRRVSKVRLKFRDRSYRLLEKTSIQLMIFVCKFKGIFNWLKLSISSSMRKMCSSMCQIFATAKRKCSHLRLKFRDRKLRLKEKLKTLARKVRYLRSCIQRVFLWPMEKMVSMIKISIKLIEKKLNRWGLDDKKMRFDFFVNDFKDTIQTIKEDTKYRCQNLLEFIIEEIQLEICYRRSEIPQKLEGFESVLSEMRRHIEVRISYRVSHFKVNHPRLFKFNSYFRTGFEATPRPLNEIDKFWIDYNKTRSRTFRDDDRHVSYRSHHLYTAGRERTFPRNLKSTQFENHAANSLPESIHPENSCEYYKQKIADHHAKMNLTAPETYDVAVTKDKYFTDEESFGSIDVNAGVFPVGFRVNCDRLETVADKCSSRAQSIEINNPINEKNFSEWSKDEKARDSEGVDQSDISSPCNSEKGPFTVAEEVVSLPVNIASGIEKEEKEEKDEDVPTFSEHPTLRKSPTYSSTLSSRITFYEKNSETYSRPTKPRPRPKAKSRGTLVNSMVSKFEQLEAVV